MNWKIWFETNNVEKVLNLKERMKKKVAQKHNETKIIGNRK